MTTLTIATYEFFILWI